MYNIRFITDSASDIVICDRDDVTVLPLKIAFGADEYLDGVDISHHEFYEKLIECDEIPKTSLIPPSDFEEAYSKAVQSSETVIAILLSGKLSGTYQSAMLAAESFPGKVFVVDSQSAAIGERILLEYALRLKDEGKCAEDIVLALNSAKMRIRVIALLDTLEYLRKGGRIPKSAAVIGSMLAIKPVLTLRDGEVVMLGKARGSRSGNNLLMTEVEKTGGIDFTMPYYLGYTGLTDALLNKYIEDSSHLWKGYTDSLPVCTIGATIGTHVGPGAIAVAFFGKE